jgi:transcriptional regulator with XRE-family HTH domain
MRQKGLTLRDIEVRSVGAITDGYVADILRGAAKNPSAEKIKALAIGLEVDAHTLLDVVCGPFEKRAGEHPAKDLVETAYFLEMMREVAESSEMIKLMEEAIQLLPEERAAVLKSLQSLNEWKRKQQSGKKPLRKTKERQ